MKNEQDGAAHFRADTGHGHRPALWHHCGPTGAHHDETVRRLQTLRAAQDVPGFRAWMAMTGSAAGRLCAGRKNRLHVASRVGLTARYQERSNSGDSVSGCGAPAFLSDRKEPMLPKDSVTVPLGPRAASAAARLG